MFQICEEDFLTKGSFTLNNKDHILRNHGDTDTLQGRIKDKITLTDTFSISSAMLRENRQKSDSSVVSHSAKKIDETIMCGVS